MSHENVLIIDPAKINLRPTDVGRSGTAITASTSPYDVPEALRSYKNDQDGSYVIEIKYMGPEEPLDTVDVGEGLFIRTGRHSKRLYEFIIRATPAFPTIGSLRNAVAFLLRTDSFSRKDNYRLLDDVFSNQSDRIKDILAFTNVNKGK